MVIFDWPVRNMGHYWLGLYVRYTVHNSIPFGELEETTKSTSSNYMDEDYPARPEI